jgi:hypothetical protein
MLGYKNLRNVSQKEKRLFSNTLIWSHIKNYMIYQLVNYKNISNTFPSKKSIVFS